MGDDGRLYVNENVVPVYKSLLKDADLILPNQFELEYVPTLYNNIKNRWLTLLSQAPLRCSNHVYRDLGRSD